MFFINIIHFSVCYNYSHDLDTLWKVTDRVAFLGEGKVLAIDSMPQLVKNPHPLIQSFFGGERGKAAEAGSKRQDK